MSEPTRQPSHIGAVEIWISHLLRTGVITSLLLVIAGTVVTFWHHRDYMTNSTSMSQLTGEGWEFPHDLRAVARSAFSGSGRGLVVAGLLVLICTPVMRVALTLVVFLVEKDKAYVILSAIVLALLATSFLLGKAGG